MTTEPRVIDGADRRKKRLLDMLSFIHNNSKDGGVTAKAIKAYMLVHFGLKNKTSADYIQECHLAGLLTLTDNLWTTTTNYKRASNALYS